MVFVVERYLPGLSHSDLLGGLSRLEQAVEGVTETRAVRYLGSTIVLGDEACFCQFDGPSEAAVAEANRMAGLSFNRIVPAITVQQKERSNSMTVSPSIPTTIEMRPSRLAGVVTTVALAAALITWALLTFAVDAGTGSAQVSVRPTSPSVPSSSPSVERFMKGVSSMAQAQQNAAVLYALGLGPQERQYVQGITSLTPVEQAAAYGRSGTLLDTLGLDPQDKQYVQGITSLTQVEQAAAFGGRRGVRFDPAVVQFMTGIASMAKAQQQAAAGK